MIIVADTSPLNYLILIGAVHVLPELYGRVIVPHQVISELRSSDAPPAVQAWAGSPPDWLEVKAPASLDASLPLDEGEKAAIALAQELKADRLLMDEREGRKVAVLLKIPVAGTLAVLRDAALAGLVDLHKAFDDLSQTTFRASPALLAEIVKDFIEQKDR